MRVYKIKISAKGDKKEVCEEISVCNFRRGNVMKARRRVYGKEE
jgi:hypothetical protein